MFSYTRRSGKSVESEGERMTNYDRIKAMSVEEMADFLMDWFMNCIAGKAPLNVKQWLEQEVSE